MNSLIGNLRSEVERRLVVAVALVVTPDDDGCWFTISLIEMRWMGVACRSLAELAVVALGRNGRSLSTK